MLHQKKNGRVRTKEAILHSPFTKMPVAPRGRQKAEDLFEFEAGLVGRENCNNGRRNREVYRCCL